jgi:hypothetical protein
MRSIAARIIWMSELTRNAKNIGEIELADPERIDAGWLIPRRSPRTLRNPYVGLDLVSR